MRIDPRLLDARAAYRLMISVVVPRPVAWVSTRGRDGSLNAAPFSYFQALSSKPPVVMISVGSRRGGEPKDTRRNIDETGEFVVGIVSEESAERMVRTSVDHPYGVSEFETAGLTALPSDLVGPPRIAECAVSLECRLERALDVGGSRVFLGEVLLVHLRDDVLLPDGTADPLRLRPLARLGGSHYAPLREVLTVTADHGATTDESELLAHWRWTRERTIAMARALAPADLAAGAGGMTVGRTLRHLAGCTNYLRLSLEGRPEEDEIKEWDGSWTGERIAAELAEDAARFCGAMRAFLPREREKLRRMVRHEAWHQGQIAALLRDRFAESALWRL